MVNREMSQSVHSRGSCSSRSIIVCLVHCPGATGWRTNNTVIVRGILSTYELNQIFVVDDNEQVLRFVFFI